MKNFLSYKSSEPYLYPPYISTDPQLPPYKGNDVTSFIKDILSCDYNPLEKYIPVSDLTNFRNPTLDEIANFKSHKLCVIRRTDGTYNYAYISKHNYLMFDNIWTGTYTVKFMDKDNKIHYKPVPLELIYIEK